MSDVASKHIIAFWFETLTPKDWYRKDPSIDAEIATRFGGIYDALKSGVPESWLDKPQGYLAAILALD